MGDRMKTPVGEPYKGPSGVGRDSYWLTHEDLIPGKDATVVIEQVLKHKEVEFQSGAAREDYLGLKFVGKKRVLGLNSTNRKILAAAFGSLTEAWWGKTINLYVTTTASFGKTVPCVRIREMKSQLVAGAEQQLGIG